MGSGEGLREADGDVFPNGYGCNQCDGTGFMPQAMLDELRAKGYRVPWSAYPPGTPHLDPDSDLAKEDAANAARLAARAALREAAAPAELPTAEQQERAKWRANERADAYEVVVRRAAHMGLCSQTHHEHLMLAARDALESRSVPAGETPE